MTFTVLLSRSDVLRFASKRHSFNYRYRGNFLSMARDAQERVLYRSGDLYDCSLQIQQQQPGFETFGQSIHVHQYQMKAQCQPQCDGTMSFSHSHNKEQFGHGIHLSLTSAVKVPHGSANPFALETSSGLPLPSARQRRSDEENSRDSILASLGRFDLIQKQASTIQLKGIAGLPLHVRIAIQNYAGLDESGFKILPLLSKTYSVSLPLQLRAVGIPSAKNHQERDLKYEPSAQNPQERHLKYEPSAQNPQKRDSLKSAKQV